MSLSTALLMAILGTVWIWIAGVIVAECVGRTNWSPLSGMTLIAVTILIVIAVNMGLGKTETIVSCMVVGAAICLAISQASDMMLDLKSGYLVGAVPRRQQMAQFIGAWLGPCIVIGLMFLLENAGRPTEVADQPVAAVVVNGEANEDGEIQKFDIEKKEYGIGSDALVDVGFTLPKVFEGLFQTMMI